MVERQLRDGGITDERVLAAMGAVPREAFVPEEHRGHAYDDSALPIGCGQTVSQPWVVAAICEALGLEGEEEVLEVGTGSGYSTAVLALLARRVVSIELIEELADRARETLQRLGFANVEVLAGDGSSEITRPQSYDAVAVHAAAPSLPAPLARALRAGGRLVIPIAEGDADMLVLIRRVDDATTDEPVLRRRLIAPTRFVPLIGEGGYDERAR
jgi:protein-L-isoaspartate(D-aspartate) O-methyltransferase